MSSTFLTPEQIVEIHRAVCKRCGGDPRIRDLAMLESAALAPQQAMFGELINKTVRSQAATYWISLVMNRPFAERNNETGMVVCEVFLHMNGQQLDHTDSQIEEIFKRVASRQINSKEKLLQSLHVRQTP